MEYNNTVSPVLYLLKGKYYESFETLSCETYNAGAELRHMM